jgi:hypothetical protein
LLWLVGSLGGDRAITILGRSFDGAVRHRWASSGADPYCPYNGPDRRRSDGEIPGRSGLGGRESPGQPPKRSFTIFEGTSEIQHLVIARAVSGLHLN